MLTIGRGQHGSTYGGNPVAARVALAALQVLVDEKLAENSYRLGQLLRHELQAIQSRIITEVISTISHTKDFYLAPVLISRCALCKTPCACHQ